MAKVSGRMTDSVDHGYSWVILASTAIIRMIVDGFWASFGVIFENVEFKFGVSPSETAVIGAICMFILYCSGKYSLDFINSAVQRLKLLD